MTRTSQSRIRVLGIIVVGVILTRFATLGLSPLFDSTEGRYAEIGREMASSGDWVTPTLGGGKAFWGKPPLHFWMTAASFRLLGFNEFAARLPSFLSTLVFLGFTYILGRRFFGPMTATWSVLILFSSALVFVGAGCVLTDMTLTACVTGAMASFILAVYGQETTARRKWGYLFFLFLGLGMLAKGPVAVALCAVAILGWSLFARRLDWRHDLPWLKGGLLALLVCAPWYILAEAKTPGFLRYFFVNENILRFLNPEYGDQYGKGHTYTYGTIWVMWLAGMLPWSPLLLLAAWQAYRKREWYRLDRRGPEALFAAWAIAPLLFFTMSRNILITYILPALPAFSILAGRYVAGLFEMDWSRGRVPRPQHRALKVIIAVTLCTFGGGFTGALFYQNARLPLPPVKMVVGIIVIFTFVILGLFLLTRRTFYPVALLSLIVPVFITYYSLYIAHEVGRRKSTRDVIAAIRSNSLFNDREVVFYKKAPYSAEFYLADKVRGLDKKNWKLKEALNDGDRDVFVIREKYLSRIPPVDIQRMKYVSSIGPYNLYINADQAHRSLCCPCALAPPG